MSRTVNINVDGIAVKSDDTVEGLLSEEKQKTNDMMLLDDTMVTGSIDWCKGVDE